MRFVILINKCGLALGKIGHYGQKVAQGGMTNDEPSETQWEVGGEEEDVWRSLKPECNLAFWKQSYMGIRRPSSKKTIRIQFETQVGFCFDSEGTRYCAITGRLATDYMSTVGAREGPTRVYNNGALCCEKAWNVFVTPSDRKCFSGVGMAVSSE